MDIIIYICGYIINGHFRNRLIGATYHRKKADFFRPKFQGISPQNMVKHMVRLRTSILGSFFIPIPRCSMVLEYLPTKLGHFGVNVGVHIPAPWFASGIDIITESIFGISQSSWMS